MVRPGAASRSSRRQSRLYRAASRFGGASANDALQVTSDRHGGKLREARRSTGRH